MAYAEKKTEGKSKWEVFQQEMRNFGEFLYSKEKGEVMGRNGKSWGKKMNIFASNLDRHQRMPAFK